MQNIANSFFNKIDQVKLLAEVQLLCTDIASQDRADLDLSVEFIRKSAFFAEKFSSLGNLSPITFDGAFLFICAEFELTVRSLIEKFVQEAILKCSQYNHLPKEMREWYLIGCANLILNLGQQKFQHIDQEQIKNSIAKCAKNSSESIIPEVFSDSEKNFWPGVIEECLSKRLGIDKPWQKISRDTDFQTALGTRTEQSTETVSKKKLEEVLHRRNDIIHRGRSYYTASFSDVNNGADFTKSLVEALKKVLENSLANL